MDHRAVADTVVLNEQVPILGGKGNDGFSDSVFATGLPLILPKVCTLRMAMPLINSGIRLMVKA